MLEGKVNIKKLDERAKVPTYGTEFSGGADLYAVLDEDVVIKSGCTVFVKTGLGYGNTLWLCWTYICKKWSCL